MRTYWIERLTPVTALAILAAQVGRRGPARVMTYEDTEPCRWLAALLRRVGITTIDTMPVALGDLVNSAGVNLYWHNDELMLQASTMALEHVPINRIAPIADTPVETLRIFFGRAAMADMHQSSARSTALWGNALRDLDQKHILLLSRSIFTPAFIEAYAHPAIRAQAIPQLRDIARLLRELLAAGKSWLISWRGSDESSTSAEPCVALQYTSGFDRSRINDIPWFEASGLRPDQILVNCTSARLKEATAGNPGFRLADINAEQSAGRPAWYRAALIKAVRAGLSILVDSSIGTLPLRLWLAGWTIAFLRARMRWENFFRHNAVRLHLHVGDADALALAATDALDRVGGIDLAYQLGGSCIELIMEHRALTGRLLFCWGDFHRGYYRTIDQRIPGKGPRGIVLSGHQHDYLAERHREAALAFRQQLHDRGIRQVIVAFDNVARRDFLISPGDVNEFYDALLDLAAADPTLAVVVKPKTRECAAFITASGDRRVPLQTEGRWIELPPETSTMAAALHGDVAVALHMGTAAMEAAIAGVPHIYYDNTAWAPHPFYRHAEKLVATDPDSLKHLLARHRDGLLSGWLETGEGRGYRDSLSPHHDGRSNQRMGTTIRQLFERLQAGDTPIEAIKSIKTIA
jgi:hypothetical protein